MQKDKEERKDSDITRLANRRFIGNRIVNVRYMTDEEAEGMGYENRPLVLFLEGGEAIWAQRDDEGNDAGALRTTHKDFVFGVLEREDA